MSEPADSPAVPEPTPPTLPLPEAMADMFREEADPLALFMRSYADFRTAHGDKATLPEKPTLKDLREFQMLKSTAMTDSALTRLVKVIGQFSPLIESKIAAEMNRKPGDNAGH